MEPLLNLAITAARQAGDIIRRHTNQLERLKISEKGKHDYFSEVDIKAEQSIIHTLQKAYPNHGFIAEESGDYQTDAECVWYIDPLDGTSNYLHGFPYYSVSIAMRCKNKIEYAVIYDPLRHECFTACRGRGAQLNDRRIRVSKRAELGGALIGSGPSIQNPKRAEGFGHSVTDLLSHSPVIRRMGSAALELAYVAAGRLDAYFEFGLKPWDIAAGALIIQEAGGIVSHPNPDQAEYISEGSIVGANPKLHHALTKSLEPQTVID